jgi:hypothetical protein
MHHGSSQGTGREAARERAHTQATTHPRPRLLRGANTHAFALPKGAASPTATSSWTTCCCSRCAAYRGRCSRWQTLGEALGSRREGGAGQGEGQGQFDGLSRGGPAARRQQQTHLGTD